MSFKEDLIYGKKGEQIARAMLEASERIKVIINCSDDKYFQHKDIDLLAERTDGKVLKIEVKTDRMAHRTGNIAWEATTSGHIGCLEKTDADYILYYLSETDEMLGFDPSKIKRHILETKPKLIDMGDAAKGYLLNIKQLEKLKLIRRIA